MSPAAEAHDTWADVPDPPRRRRREAVSWASAEELEVLGGLGEGRVADWTVLTLERDAAAEPAPVVRFERAEASREAEATAADDRLRPEPVEREPFDAVATAEPPLALVPDAPPARPPGQRRTVVIRGQVAPRPLAPAERRRPPRRTRDRVGHRPDRVALWAFMLGLLLILVAVLTAGAPG
jgi:hypothetical protein